MTDSKSNTDEIKSPTIALERTLALIKPGAVSKGHVSAIIKEIENHEFTIIAHKQYKLTIDHAQNFYKEHAGRSFYNELCEFMASGTIHAFVLEKDSAIKCWRSLLGPTNTFTARETAPQSIRGRFGTDLTANAGHGSDSTQSANREIKFFFPEISQPMSEMKSNLIVDKYMSQILKGSSNDETLKEYIVRGLCKLAEEKPSSSELEVVEWLAHWLLDNNPSKPQIKEPVQFVQTDAFCDLTFVEKMQYLNEDKNEISVVFVLGKIESEKKLYCQKISDKYGYTYISVNDLCVIESNQNFIDIGKELQTDIILGLLEKQMLESKGYTFVLNGFPCNLDQCILFETKFCKCKFAINFKCNDKVLIDRYLEQQKKGNNNYSDDGSRETIEKQLKIFHEQMDEVIEYLRSVNKIKDVDAVQESEGIWGCIQQAKF